jgi:hypothetical protein
VLAIWLAESAQARECDQIFAAGRLPTLLNPRMAARTKIIRQIETFWPKSSKSPCHY